MLLTRVRDLIDRATNAFQNASERTRTARREAVALVTLCAGALTVLSLFSFRANDGSLNHVPGIYHGATHNWVGPVGAMWADLCLQVLGLLSWALAAGLLYVGARTLVGKTPQPTRRQVITAIIFLVSVGTLIELLMLGRRMHYPLGGVFGAILARSLREHFAPVGAAVIAMTGAILAFPFGVAGMLSSLAKRFGVAATEESHRLWQQAETRLETRGLLTPLKRRRLSLAGTHPARALPEAEAQPASPENRSNDTVAESNVQPLSEHEGFAAPPSWLLSHKADASPAEQREPEPSTLAPAATQEEPLQSAQSFSTSAGMAEQLARETERRNDPLAAEDAAAGIGVVADAAPPAAPHTAATAAAAEHEDEAAFEAGWDAEGSEVDAAHEARAAEDAAVAQGADEDLAAFAGHTETSGAKPAELAAQAGSVDSTLAVAEHEALAALEEEVDAQAAANEDETMLAEAAPPFVVDAGAERQQILEDPSDAYAASAIAEAAEPSPAAAAANEDAFASLAGGPNLAGSAAEALAASEADAEQAHAPAKIVYEHDQELDRQALAGDEEAAPSAHEYVFEGQVPTDTDDEALAAQQGPSEERFEGHVDAEAMLEDESIDEDEWLAAEDVEEQDFDAQEEGDEALTQEAAVAADDAPTSPYEKPPTSLLHFEATAHTPVAQTELEANAERLEATLRTYGIDGHVREIRPGPVVTMYEYVPGPGIKLARIASLADDLAMSMEALRVRIVAPIPGKGAVGIEIPNEQRDTVHLKEIVESQSFGSASAPLSCALGKDIEGAPVTKNLAHMPHLLVAGATGAGKSVSVNAMIMSLLFKATPEEVRMIMVDPKMLELSVYEGIPHLLLPVVTDPKKAALALRWAVEEMERRYELLSEVGVRSIDNYNQKIRAAKNRGETVTVAGNDPDMPRKACAPLPYILVIVDELADLMMVASREVETSIMRLAQMARAAGIHLILATQRPSVDVITGVIKANFPSRIAFQVASRHDSRTIIDANGAEHLLGRGDMLLMSHAAGGLQRIHGAFVGEDDIERTVAFVRAQGTPQYDESILLPRNDEMAQGDDEDLDEMYDQAVAVVAETQQASVSMIQRRMRIGYNRAARMVERMEREGVVGPGDGAKPREVLVSAPP